MRKTMIFGALAALLGLAAVAQASGDDRSVMPPAGQVTQERTTDGRDSVHDRSERREHAREAGERHGDDREGRDEGRERERHDRD